MALGAALLVACGAPDDSVEGVIRSETPLRTPIGGEPACLAEIRGNRTRQYVNRSRDSIIHSDPRLAPGARFVVEGQELTLDGTVHSHGGSTQMGESWTGQGPAPEALADYGPDGEAAVACHPSEGSPPSSCSSDTRYRIYEHFVPCGETISLRGHVEGDRFVLHDHRSEETGAALAIFGTTGVCILCPIVLVVGALLAAILFVWRRSARKKPASG